jgi:hypothetical protein
MMTLKTLSPMYRPAPRTKPPTAIQMISLHLAIHRPTAGQPSSCGSFGPYISVLPTEFDGHPLTWVVRKDQAGERLLACSTANVQRQIHKLYDRFQQDLNAVQTYLVSLI